MSLFVCQIRVCTEVIRKLHGCIALSFGPSACTVWAPQQILNRRM